MSDNNDLTKQKSPTDTGSLTQGGARRASGGGMFGNLTELKRGSGQSEANQARKASLAEQSAAPKSIVSETWNNVMKGGK